MSIAYRNHQIELVDVPEWRSQDGRSVHHAHINVKVDGEMIRASAWADEVEKAVKLGKAEVDRMIADDEFRADVESYQGRYTGDPEGLVAVNAPPAIRARVVVYAAGYFRKGIVEHVTKSGTVTVVWIANSGNEIRRKRWTYSKLSFEFKPEARQAITESVRASEAQAPQAPTVPGSYPSYVTPQPFGPAFDHLGRPLSTSGAGVRLGSSEPSGAGSWRYEDGLLAFNPETVDDAPAKVREEAEALEEADAEYRRQGGTITTIPEEPERLSDESEAHYKLRLAVAAANRRAAYYARRAEEDSDARRAAAEANAREAEFERGLSEFEAARSDPGPEAEIPQDPTGVDCQERYEGPEE